MKKFQVVALLLVLLATVFSCQKEINRPEGESEGALKKDSDGNCLPMNVNGVYREDSTLDGSHFIDVQIDVTTPGSYSIYTDSINGYVFKGDGYVGSAGSNTVRIFGSGKPVGAGTDTLIVHYGLTICELHIMVIGPSTGEALYTLGGAPGDCSGVIQNGNLIAGTPADATNFIQLNVNVTSTGTYNIIVPGVNGISFSGQGVFSTLGVQSVRLNAQGTPIAPGNFNFTASNTTTSCTFSIDVLPSGAGATAVYTLDATAGACNGAVVNGTYAAGVAMTASNSAFVTVNVTTTGTYNITTGTVNGITFSKSGSFTTTGIQQVVLLASGTPVTSGAFNFSANTGSSTCTFSVNVTASAVNTDYLPMTTNSNWTYRMQASTPDDTFYLRVLPNPITLAGTSYRIFEDFTDGVRNDSTFYRKTGSRYYQYYNFSLGVDNPFNVDGMILDTSLSVGTTWTVNLGSNSISGIPVQMQYIGEILEKNASATIGGTTFTNSVIKVKQTYSYDFGAGFTDFIEEEVWYARGYGIVFTSINDVPVTTTEAFDLIRVQIF